jgi:hypothetical protein
MGLKISFVKPKNQKNSVLKSQFGLCKKPFPPDVTKKYFERALVFLICRIKSKKQVLVHYFIRQVGAAKYFLHNPQRWCPHPYNWTIPVRENIPPDTYLRPGCTNRQQ